MPPARRADLLRVFEALDLLIVEGNVYGFLDSLRLPPPSG
jgi:DNA-binding transcriptional MocR family regulator